MHGLIFVTFERYLTERFSSDVVQTYHEALSDENARHPFTNRVYADADWLAGMDAVSRATQISVDQLLREYGRHYILNALTGNLCAYLLNHVHCARDLLLLMRKAHAQLAHAIVGVDPPIFDYKAITPDMNSLILIYASPRHMCSLLFGTIEGAAERYHEKVAFDERACMKMGAPSCRIEVHFTSSAGQSSPTTQDARWQDQKQLIDFIYSFLPDDDGITLAELRERLRHRNVPPDYLRPYILLRALEQLQFAG
ncbi:MAG TPA: heme NO-binding domain-containing protein, partial [Ktedonobacterales bacterium]|nr:heme NO-binding domain-containing protein [Ktedonobacterales bacterium]